MELVLDTSALIHFFFGSTNTSKNIRKTLNSYKKLYITNIIRYEFRNIFLDFFRFIDIYRSIIEKVRENIIPDYETFSELIEEISQKYFMRPQQFGRLRMIYEEIIKLYLQKTEEVMLRGLNKKENRKQIFIDRLETIVWEYKIKLLNVYNKLLSYIILNDFNCALSNWEYFYNAEKDIFEVSNKETCSVICTDIEEKIIDFLQNNQEFINQILKNYIKLSKKNDIKNYDKDLISVLQNMNNKEDYKIGVRDCKKLGDLYISSVIENDRNILTRNKDHFLLLLLCKNREYSLVLF